MDTVELNMSDLESPTTSPEKRSKFHEPHLLRVSRSFAYGISRLEPQLRASVGLAYLICRLLDTVEDANWSHQTSEANSQTTAFALFSLFLTKLPLAGEQIQNWINSFPSTIDEGEKKLLDDSEQIFREFINLETQEREAMLGPILSMSRGMSAFAIRKEAGGAIRLHNLTDVNTYCFFVAGVVGELLTNLVSEEFKAGSLEQALIDGTHFGLFLQKINVLKDQWNDEKENRFLVPDRNELIGSARTNAAGAFSYISSIPISRRDFRLFCAWSLYLGLATVPLLRTSKTGEPAAKLGRISAVAMGAKIELIISDNKKLKSVFDDLAESAWPISERSEHAEKKPASTDTTASKKETASLLKNCYTGKISTDALLKLLTSET